MRLLLRGRTRMAQIECPECMASMPAENKFCTNCGLEMHGIAQPAPLPFEAKVESYDEAAAASDPLAPPPLAHAAAPAVPYASGSAPRPPLYGLISRGSVAYDPQIIQSFADGLYQRADEIVLMSTIIGALIGAAFGFAVLSVSSSVSGVGMVALLLGIAGGGYFGRRRGIAKTFQLKLEAQLALCQVELELNTRTLRDGA